MPNVSEMRITPNAVTQDLMKQWLTELTSYTPQQVDRVIAQIEQQRIQTAQSH
ncbi:MAG: hypothetical protein HC790_01435 [Acaryochloridaceae cyanobacterium CSU_3_4]|nr:hypothetical protein [Acaryochloris sp. SU_5_25]NJN37673.1 hypothetical protein [Acaryochloridaceae cyanobacterium CSU_3_4]